MPIVMATIFTLVFVFFLRDIKPNSYSNIPTNSLGRFIRKDDGSTAVSFARLKAEQVSNVELLKQEELNSNNTYMNPDINLSTDVFIEQPDYSLDFSSMPAGTLISSMFRIQNGIDNDWNPAWNDEKQIYTPKNVLIKDGNLVIYSKVESNGQITAGKVDTNGFFSATYGRFEVEAKMPTGIGTFPAIWLLPAEGSFFRDNIATQSEKNTDISWQGSGEIDIMEYLGILPNSVFHYVHTYNSLLNNSKAASSETQIMNIADGYHIYGIDWTPDYIAFTVDGIRTHIVTKSSGNHRDWPFDKPFYFIINLAMGGTWNEYAVNSAGYSFPNGIDNSSEEKWILSIKSIKHFPYIP